MIVSGVPETHAATCRGDTTEISAVTRWPWKFRAATTLVSKMFGSMAPSWRAGFLFESWCVEDLEVGEEATTQGRAP
jgi:hypothetical protein